MKLSSSSGVALGRRDGLGLSAGKAADTTLAKLGATWIFAPKKLTLLVADPTKISAAGDGGGGSVAFSSPGGSEQTIDTTGPTGATGIRLSNGTGKLVSSTGGPTGATPWHVVIVGQLKADNTTAYKGIWLVGDFASTHAFALVEHSNHVFLSTDNVGSNSAFFPPDLTSTVNVLLPHVLEIQYDGATISLWYDGQHYAPSDKAATLAISSAIFGFQRFSNGNAMPDYRIDSCAFKSGGLFARADVEKFLRYEVKRRGKTERISAFFGDSYTGFGGSGNTVPHALPASVRAQQAGANVIYAQNCGIGGARSDQVLTALLAHRDPITHAVLQFFANDANQHLPAGLASSGVVATDAATIYGVMVTATAAIHARGAKITLLTSPQWGPGGSAPLPAGGYWDLVRAAFNALIVANSAGADSVVDISALMGSFNASNFGTDQLHPTDAANDAFYGPAIYASLATL